jgi:cellulose biosynthesis protein BcsQ
MESMIVAFWSNVHGQPRTTSNMITVAVAIAMIHKRKCLVTQTHFNLNNLESCILGSRENSKEVFIDIGLDGLASILKLRAIDQDIIENYSIPLLNKNLTLLPGTSVGNRKVFMNDMGKTVSMLLAEINKHYEFVFVDVNSGADEVSKLIMDQADIVVVNLCQNKSVLDNYITQLKSFDKKIMYLFGSYDRNSTYNLHNLKLMYKQFTKRYTGVIPYNIGFMDSQSDGSVIKYLKKNIAAKKDGFHDYFIECIIDATDKLIKLASEKKGEVIR